MAQDLGVLSIAVEVGLDKLDKGLDKARGKAKTAGDDISRGLGDKSDAAFARSGRAADAWGEKLGKVGTTMTKTLTPVAVAAGAVMLKAFGEFDAGADAITSRAGLMGPDLDDALDSMKSLGGEISAPLSQIGNTMADVAAATRLTGKPLEDMTRQIVQLNEMGQQLTGLQVQRFLGDWSIGADQAAGAMDKVFAASQMTGVPMAQLLDTVVQFGAPLRAFGFSWDESVSLIAKFTREGVNTEAVLAGMKVGLGKMAKAGEAPVETFRRLVGEMKGAATEGDAFAISVEAFGTRAGPDLAMAVREGRFSIDDFGSAISDSNVTVDSAYQKTLDWGDRLEMLKNKVFGVLGPVGQFGFALSGVAAAIGPILKGAGWLIGWLAGLGGSGAAAGAGLTATAVGETAAGTAALAATAPTAGFGAALMSVLWPVALVVAAILLMVGIFFLLTEGLGFSVPDAINIMLMLLGPPGQIAAAIMFLWRNWDAIWGWISARLEGAVGFILGVLAWFKGAWDATWASAAARIQEASDIITGIVAWFADRWGGIWGWITERVSGAVGAIAGVFDTLGGAISRAAEWIIGTLRGVWDWIIGAANAVVWAVDRVRSAISSVARIGGGIFGGAASLLGFAGGGIVPGPIGAPVAAIVHGGELVIPPDEIMGSALSSVTLPSVGIVPSDRAALSRGERSEGGQLVNINVNVSGSVVSAEELTDSIYRGLKNRGLRQGGLTFGS